MCYVNVLGDFASHTITSAAAAAAAAESLFLCVAMCRMRNASTQDANRHCAVRSHFMSAFSATDVN